MAENYYKYFVYSSEHANREESICKTIGKKYKPLTVIANGKQKQYTEMLDDPKDSRYTDSIIVVAGDIRGMTYTTR